ncbi:MAG: hypothetical protein Q8N88_07020 [Nanoarchaeota archaeon]|nr:hypothetical protein [Nanoarchaeota archaeon]
MEITDVEKVERTIGVTSTVKAKDFIEQYSEGVSKFLRDNQQSMGDDWVRDVSSKLYDGFYGAFYGANKEGDVLGSSTDIGVAIATFTDVPLISGQQLLSLYKQAGNKNPFGNVYVDFGALLNGNPEINKIQAKLLLDALSHRGINERNGVLNFSQLRLIANSESGLAYKLADGVINIEPVSTYPFWSAGKNGLFRAYLFRDGFWYAGDGGLAHSYDVGRVVRYDAEGVSTQKSEEGNLVEILTKEFRKKF